MDKHISVSKMDEADQVELGLSMIKSMDRPADSDLRILFFTACYFVLDGVTLTIRRIESHVRANGATVKVLSTVPDDATPEEIADVIVVPGIKIPFTQAGAYSFGVGLDEHTIAQIEAFKPNIVHFTCPDFVAMDGIRWCQKNGIPYIATWHSNYCDYLRYYLLEWVAGPFFDRYLKGFYEQIPTLYVPTPYMLGKMEKDWGYGVSTQLKEWGRGCDLKIFSPDRRSNSFRESKGIAPHEVVILWVGRLVPEKRPDIWLNVVKRLQAEGLPVKGMVVGHGTFDFGLSKSIVCCGWLSGVHLAEAYASADILVFPSAVETFGNVTLEALAAGCTCVVEEKCGGHLVEHGVNGFCCRADDFDDFLLFTGKIVKDAAMRKEMGKHAREGAWKFERHKIMQQMAENYKDAIVQYRDPTFMKKFLQSSPEASGRNILSTLCCNFWLLKVTAEPFMNSTKGVHLIVDTTQLCVSQSRARLNCSSNEEEDEDIQTSVYDSEQSRYEDERKGRHSSANHALIARFFNGFALAFSYALIGMLMYASFTV